MKVFKSAWALYREQGWPGVFRRALHSLWSRKKYIVYRKDLCTADQPSRLPGVRFRLAGIQDIPWMCDQRDDLGDKAEPILRQQFQGTDMTAIGVTEGNRPELVFSVWLSHEDYGLSLLEDNVGSEDVSIRRVWVGVSRRNMGLATQGLAFAEHAARKEGIPLFWSFVLENNVPSRRLHEKMRYADFARIELVKQFRGRYTRFRTIEQDQWHVRALPNGIVKL